MVVMEKVIEVDGSKRMKALHTYKPRAWMWLNTKPHLHIPQEMSKPMLLGWRMKKVSYSCRDSVRALVPLATVGLTLLPYKLEQAEDVTSTPNECCVNLATSTEC